MALEFTDSNLKGYIAGDKPVVVDFWAEWCGPCRMIAPIIGELATEYEGKVAIGKMNVDENNEFAAQFGIRSIPTILFFKGGNLVDKHVGLAQKAVLKEKIDALL